MSNILKGLQLEFLSDIAVLHMTNEDNRLNPTFLENFHRALDQVEKNSDCRALVTTGVGKFYCNGLDLDHVASIKSDEAAFASWMDKVHTVMARIMTFPLPTVAAINGHAFAAGAYLAISHDSRVMVPERGWLCWNEVAVGIRFTEALVEIAKAKMASHVLSKALALGYRFPANEALAVGLVDAVSPSAKLLADAKIIAYGLAGKPGLDRKSVATLKNDIYHTSIKLARTALTRMPKF